MELNNQQDRLLDSMEVEDLDEEMRYVSQPLPSKKASHPWAPLIYTVIYVIISLGTVLTNHAVFNTGNIFFPYPLTLTWFELALTFVILTLGSELNALVPSRLRLNIPEFEFEWQTVKSIFPIGLFHAMVLTSSMYCLKLMNSSLYSITRSSSILFTIVFCIAILKYRLPPVLTIAAFITMFGFAMIQSSQAQFSLGGIIIGTVSSALTGFYFVYLKNSISFVKNDVWKLFQYHTILSIIFLIIPLLLSGEIQEIANNSQWAHDYNVRGYILLSSFLGFLVQAATLNTLKVSNPVSFVIAVALKFALQGVFVNLAFHSPLYGLDIFGIVLTLLGAISYGYISYKTPIMF